MEKDLGDRPRSSDSLWQVALDQSASGIVIYEADRRDDGQIDALWVRLVNRRAEDIIGLARQDMINQKAANLFPSAQPTTLWENIHHVINTGKPHRSELFYQVSRTHKDHWFDLCIEPVGDGQCAVVSFTDITALKSTTQALMGEAILFETLSTTVPGMCVVVVDHNQQILFANGELPGLYSNRHPEEMIGQPIIDTIIPEFKADWKRYVGTALNGEQHSFSDHWGGWRCECYVGPVRNELGEITMGICVYRNVSEQYRQQQTLQRMNNDLQRSNKSLEQFAYVASHDLQEPLRKIKSFGDVLAERYADQLDEAGHDLIRRMQSAADRMNTLIRNLLNYARLTPPTDVSQQANYRLISLIDLLNDLQTDLEVMVNEHQAILKVGTTIPMVPGDPTQLRQLFQNLIVNAIKFSRPDIQPKVTVSGSLIRGVDVPEFPTVDRTQEYAIVSVQDNGIGIDPKDYEKIFGLFSRLHGRQQFAGSGIGLATCKRVVENHGGTIAVESKVGRGSTFRVYLPLHVPEQIVN
ncbi:Phytochrome-like protein cph1 [Fibrisoma limi BUZ 3]|uniref:histidine kinase n=1 Tax=Fibrisoma limi BUZ 3 TaxID=1185876 RepID=I2GND3_9BACT|nr:ATP-binding protein [Fibrisoma limi]CCH55411.1 Phytochrome-like protein cph1 [Fibrisoma limi BUZ 3]